jgi:hypothetical protein
MRSCYDLPKGNPTPHLIVSIIDWYASPVSGGLFEVIMEIAILFSNSIQPECPNFKGL